MSRFGPNAALQECTDYHIFSEYKALKRMLVSLDNKKDTLNYKYKKARYNILDYIITCVKNDKDRGDYYDEDNIEKIKEAGRLLWEEGGERSMRDSLVWAFIPRRYHSEIDHYWSGIGTWLA